MARPASHRLAKGLLLALVFPVLVFAQKAVVPKTWVVVPSFDGLRYSAYPNGDKPAPGSTDTLLLYTDIIAGPTDGGQGGNGAYLSIFGRNLATNFSELGGATRVYVCGTEVANYRVFQPAVGVQGGAVGTGVYNTLGIQRLTVQVGALGSPTPGVPCAIDIKKNGVSTPINATNGSGQYLDLDGQPLTFTPQPGPIVFVDPVNGLDTNNGSYEYPKQHLQYWDGNPNVPITGALFFPASPGGATQANVVKPGTHIILRGGTYTYHVNSANLGPRWAVMFLATGTAPNGASPTNTVTVNGVATNAAGPIVITSYPGHAGANAPELAAWAGGSGSAGGIHGTDSVRSTATTPWGFNGYGQYITISNLKITSYPASPADAAPINKQSGAHYWRIVNNELTWQASGSSAQSGGIAGWGHNSVHYGNYIHDIYGTSALENHGIYSGSSSSDTEVNGIYAYNVITNVTGGSCHQFQNSAGVAESGFSVHHSWYSGCGKYAFNANQLGSGGISGKIWNNVLTDGQAGITLNTDSSTGFNIVGNTIVGWTIYAGLRVLSSSAATAPVVQNNIFYQRAANGSTFGLFSSPNGGSVTLDTNLWYDANSPSTPKPSGDSGGIGGSGANPLFINLGAKDFGLQSGSPALNVGVTPAITVNRDFLFLARPQASQPSLGAFE